ncbi:MAG: aminoglycoside 6-adenylyltransferase [Candidatus Hermodarchaeota archaeon]
MKKIEKQYEQLIEKFVQWAETVSDIRAAIVVGSRARIDHPADEWADLDIMVITTDPERYISTTDWIENMDSPLLTFVEPTPGDDMERRVLFEGMLDVDFAIVPERNVQQLLQHGVPSQLQAELFNVFGRGMRILVDKDKIGSQLQKVISSIKTPTPRPPPQNEFLEVINDFLFHAVFTAKHLQRGELWWTITCLNCYMQRLLHRMIEWHAKATYGWSYETWFRGRFLEEWADPRVLKGLQVSFAHYDEEDIKNALLAVMDLFRLIAMDTAERLNYPYPIKADKNLTDWIRQCFSR